MSNLEQDFREVIKEKMKQAADLIKEASELAEENDTELLDHYAATGLLFSALDNAGWTTSSLEC